MVYFNLSRRTFLNNYHLLSVLLGLNNSLFISYIHISPNFQFVYHAYNTLLGHLRSKAFESFKTGLEQLLKKGEGFAASVRTCTQSCMLKFDQGCAGKKILYNWYSTSSCIFMRYVNTLLLVKFDKLLPQSLIFLLIKLNLFSWLKLPLLHSSHLENSQLFLWSQPVFFSC